MSTETLWVESAMLISQVQKRNADSAKGYYQIRAAQRHEGGDQPDKEILDKTYAVYKKLTEKKPYPTLRGIEFQIEDVARKQAKAKGTKPEDFI
jgi:hypothetical protein